jgi:hypothetical protein
MLAGASTVHHYTNNKHVFVEMSVSHWNAFSSSWVVAILPSHPRFPLLLSGSWCQQKDRVTNVEDNLQ